MRRREGGLEHMTFFRGADLNGGRGFFFIFLRCKGRENLNLSGRG